MSLPEVIGNMINERDAYSDIPAREIVKLSRISGDAGQAVSDDMGVIGDRGPF
jgi:hypothetical protein